MARTKKIEIVKSIIIDASVATRWYINEEWTDCALELRADYKEGKLKLIAPYLIYYEVGNALRYFEDITQTDIIGALNSLMKMQLLLIYFEEELIEKITKIAFLNNLTIYDSCYCALAEKYGYKLITGDERLKDKLNKPYFVSLKDYNYNKI